MAAVALLVLLFLLSVLLLDLGDDQQVVEEEKLTDPLPVQALRQVEVGLQLEHPPRLQKCSLMMMVMMVTSAICTDEHDCLLV